MNKVWSWIIGISVGLIILAMIVFDRSDREAYWYARGAVVRPEQTKLITVVRYPRHLHVYTQPVSPLDDFYLWKK